MSIYSNDKKNNTGKVAVLTKDGSKLIGFIVELDDSVESKSMFSFLPISDQEGIWLRREKHLTFLGDDNIELIRPVNPGEKEMD